MKKNNDIKLSSNRSFGIVFFIVFLLITIYPLFNNEEIRLWSLILSFLFLVLGIFNSKILSPLNKIWFKFGLFLGKIVSPIVMAIVFFGVVTPTSIVMKIFKKNLLGLKKNNKKTYWVEKPLIKSRMKNQF
jgi:predicted membrane protein|tara:strand:- start:177 stop:569 length:393 start_codon:yes stop_codon:yes gene_type:complete